ncbi:hypothetical protein B0J12DRAFT_116839 [Macrophomina phaseolina]|uniref:Uncharacterized protein n=1 Tax=Macrophomina phaseolina TaxID=35725 RepID=A0ABQ8G951_9PEZI|nr:hypothetical protein B0J12DRAFT_116839 [Macrophomina phaseolina]
MLCTYMCMFTRRRRALASVAEWVSPSIPRSLALFFLQVVPWLAVPSPFPLSAPLKKQLHPIDARSHCNVHMRDAASFSRVCLTAISPPRPPTPPPAKTHPTQPPYYQATVTSYTNNSTYACAHAHPSIHPSIPSTHAHRTQPLPTRSRLSFCALSSPPPAPVSRVRIPGERVFGARAHPPTRQRRTASTARHWAKRYVANRLIVSGSQITSLHDKWGREGGRGGRRQKKNSPGARCGRVFSFFFFPPGCVVGGAEWFASHLSLSLSLSLSLPPSQRLHPTEGAYRCHMASQGGSNRGHHVFARCWGDRDFAFSFSHFVSFGKAPPRKARQQSDCLYRGLFFFFFFSKITMGRSEAESGGEALGRSRGWRSGAPGEGTGGGSKRGGRAM